MHIDSNIKLLLTNSEGLVMITKIEMIDPKSAVYNNIDYNMPPPNTKQE